MTRFLKGHGTENDFVLLDDPDGLLDVTPDLVRRLCDRQRGLGGDGLIRVVRSAALGQPGPEWFMDYRNADGSVSEMCGNGVRVFTAALLRLGHVDLPDGGELAVATRAGVKTVRRTKDDFGTDLGPWRVDGGTTAVAAGADLTVTAHGLPPLPGLGVNVGNPHVVVVLPDEQTLAAVDLTVAPVVEPEQPDGINVEFVVPLHHAASLVDQQPDEPDTPGHLAMRVYERGVGETRSCGTGAVAAVIAARVWAGPMAPATWAVDVPGGRLQVDVPGADLAAGQVVVLSGPAVLVADGELLEVGAVARSTR
jgi:diaminopimelate epimerase